MEIKELLRHLKKDAEMALNGKWNRGDDGFEAQIILIDDYLEELENTISIVWCVEDVQGSAKEMGIELSEEDAKEVLQNIKRTHDCELGISWMTIEIGIEYYLQEQKGKETTNE